MSDRVGHWNELTGVECPHGLDTGGPVCPNCEQSVIAFLAASNARHISNVGTPGLGRARLAEQVRQLLYHATGTEWEVRQVIPPPTNPRMDDRQKGVRRWR